MADRNEFAVFDEFVTGLFAKFAQRNLFNLLLISVVVIDLARGHFPDRLSDRDAFLTDENNFTVPCHGRDNDGCFAMHNCPRARLVSRWRSDVIGHDLEMRVGKVPLARDGFPIGVFHAGKIMNAGQKSESSGNPFVNFFRALSRLRARYRSKIGSPDWKGHVRS